jgi:predicted DNA-binding protein
MKKNNLVRTVLVRLSDESMKKLDAAAKKSGHTRSSFLRWVIHRFLERREK